MGDARYDAHLARILNAPDRTSEIRKMDDDAIIQALAAVSRNEADPYLANVLATEAMNRMHRSRTISTHIGDGVYTLDPRGRVVYVNPAAERMLGWSRAELAGRDMHEVTHTNADGTPLPREECPILEPLQTAAIVIRDEGVFRRKDGTTFPVAFVSAPVARDGLIEGTVVAFRDATEGKRAEALLTGQRRVLEHIAAADAPLDVVLTELVRLIESQDEGLLASVLLLEASGRRLRNGAAPSLPAAYTQAIDGIEMGLGRGSCGAAAFHNRAVHAADIARSPCWADFRDLALKHGLRACWSNPIRAIDGTVLGTFAIYSRKPREPSPHHLQLIEVATHLASLAIDQARTRERLQSAAAVIEATSDAVVTSNLRGEITGWNAGAESLYGYAADEILGRPVGVLVPPHRKGETHALLARLRQGERVSGYPTQRVARDGRVIDVTLTASPLLDAQDRIVGVSGIIREVTSTGAVQPLAPGDEVDRLRVLHRYRVLDSPPEPEFDDLARLAAQVCEAPIALVSLVDAGRQYFKAHIGLPIDQTSRDLSFCAHAIRDPANTFVVEDATKDPRFRDNALVTSEPNIRFYAGAPILTSSGHALGTLCVIDRKPRTLTPPQATALRTLARQVSTVLELRRAVADLAAEPSAREGA